MRLLAGADALGSLPGLRWQQVWDAAAVQGCLSGIKFQLEGDLAHGAQVTRIASTACRMALLYLRLQ